MYLLASCASLAWVSLFALAQASYLNTDLSFGGGKKLSANNKDIPHWHVDGGPGKPEILSNKIILTPPGRGNQRGCAWSEKQLENSLWTADVDFRATGPERGGGNLQIYYARDGKEVLGTSSIYTAGKFDGLAIVIDQYAGTGGFIRGFLNDGSTEYSSHHSVDSLAFGHCAYSYRNLGRPSRIRIQQTVSSFKVSVDNVLCFETSKVMLPVGNHFGLTAASAENPDSFEVFQFLVSTEHSLPDHLHDNLKAQEEAAPVVPTKYATEKSPVAAPVSPNDILKNTPAEVLASSITSTDAQFADLHNRIQALARQVTFMANNFATYQNAHDARAEASTAHIARLETSIYQIAASLPSLEKKMDSVLTDVKKTKEDLHDHFDRKMGGLTSGFQSAHMGILEHIAENALNVGRVILILVGSQAVMVIGYLIYKKRQNSTAKKFL